MLPSFSSYLCYPHSMGNQLPLEMTEKRKLGQDKGHGERVEKKLEKRGNGSNGPTGGEEKYAKYQTNTIQRSSKYHPPNQPMCTSHLFLKWDRSGPDHVDPLSPILPFTERKNFPTS